jgi:cardiolipin synthase
MLAIGGILLGPYGPFGLPYLEIGDVLLWIAALLTLVTGYDYLRASLKYMPDDAARPAASSVSTQSAPASSDAEGTPEAEPAIIVERKTASVAR